VEVVPLHLFYLFEHVAGHLLVLEFGFDVFGDTWVDLLDPCEVAYF